MVFKTANQSLYTGGNAGWTGDTTNTAVVNNQTISYWIPKMEVNKGKGLTAEGDYIKVKLRNEVNNTTYGNGEGGLKFDANETLVVNAPTCNTGAGGSDSSATPTPNAITNTNEGSTDNSGRLVWTGTRFDCQRISDQVDNNSANGGGGWGDVDHTKSGTTVTLGHIPNITVNQYGELKFGENPVNIIDGVGIAIAADGTISIPNLDNDGLTIAADGMYINTGYGIIRDADAVRIWLGGSSICHTSQEKSGLYWDGTGSFGCNPGLAAGVLDGVGNVATSVYVGSYGNGFYFQAGTGLTVTQSGNVFNHGVDTSVLFPNPGCTATQKLTFNGASFGCDIDINTTYGLTKSGDQICLNITGGGSNCVADTDTDTRTGITKFQLGGQTAIDNGFPWVCEATNSGYSVLTRTFDFVTGVGANGDAKIPSYGTHVGAWANDDTSYDAHTSTVDGGYAPTKLFNMARSGNSLKVRMQGAYSTGCGTTGDLTESVEVYVAWKE